LRRVLLRGGEGRGVLWSPKILKIDPEPIKTEIIFRWATDVDSGGRGSP